METIKNNLNEKVSNLIEEVQKLNTLINCFGKAMLRECQYSRWKCLEINGIPSSVSDKDLEEVVWRLPKLELILPQMTLRTATVLETKAQP